MISDEVDINDFYWGLKTKFKLEIGIVNSLSNEYSSIENELYPEVIWFQEGIFIVTNFSTSITTSSCTISLQGKDKMSLLNGDLGGQLFASIDFGQEEIKTAIMTPATVDANNSDVLMSDTYYIKIPAASNTAPNYISAVEETDYQLIADNAEGYYYKKNLEYIKDSSYSGQKYMLYKKVTHPSELYEFVAYHSGEISPNTYYYKKYDNYYVLNRTKSLKAPAQGEADDKNYALTQLYLLDYEYTIKKIPLEKIIRESVHAYAKEPYHNIIINDLDSSALEQLTYRGDKPLYALRNVQTGHFIQLLMDGTNQSLQNLISTANFSFDALVSDITTVTGTKIKLESGYNNEKFFRLQTAGEADTYFSYTVAKFEYGQDIGYRITDLTYTGDLITSIGDTLVSVLDKIKAMLGDFEYFYDINGHFVFQRKRTYVNTSWSLLTKTDDETYVDYVNSDHKKFSFNFEGNRLLTAVQNAPILNNLRNDFSVWGKRKTVSGAEVPIHARYAIDKKPQFYHALSDKIYVTEDWIEVNYDSPLLEENEQQLYRPFEKEPVPKCLWKDNEGNSDWWEVSNWGRWYELQVGAPPSGAMMKYQTTDESTGEKGFKGTITFSNGQILNCDRGNGQLMLDLRDDGNRGMPYTGALYPQEFNEEGNPLPRRSYGSYDQHRWGGCGHTFLLVLQVNAANPGMKSYIYKPVMPDLQTQQEDIQNKDDNPITTPDSGERKLFIVDWREIIYQMALDYFAGSGCSVKDPVYNINDEIVLDDPDQLLSVIAENNPDYYPTGYTGYEQYYTDMQGFWRQLYNPDYVPKVIWEKGTYEDKKYTDQAANTGFYIRRKEWQDASIKDYEIQYYITLNNPYIIQQYQELIARWNGETDTIKKQDIYDNQVVKFCKYCFQNTNIDNSNINLPFAVDEKKMYWNIDVFENPEKLNFWIEFLDSPTELAEFSIPVAGDRSKTINEDKASAIIFREIPDVILCDQFEKDDETGEYTYRLDVGDLKNDIQDQSGYTFIYLPKGFSEYFTISYRSISVKNKIDELLYQFGYCIENISITALPVYHLQPNTRIYVQDKTTNINGEYIVNKITIPLTYNGTMSINANKAPERFY